MALDYQISKAKRKFYPEHLKANSWKTIKKEFLSLLNTPLNNPADLEYFISKSGEGIKIIFDYRNQLFTKMKAKTSLWNFFKFVWFQKRIISKGLAFNNQWESKINKSPAKKFLENTRYQHLFKLISHQQKMYSHKNDKLISKEEGLGNRYNLLTSRLKTTFNGKKYQIAEIERKLLSQDRELRKQAFFSIAHTYQEKKRAFSSLFTELINLRHTIAKNAGFENYRNYAHVAKGRFCYSIEDLFNIHKTIEQEVVPLLGLINCQLATDLKVPQLQPWDMKVENHLPLKPYNNENDLYLKCIDTLNDIRKGYEFYFQELIKSGFIDLFSRPKKSHGSYNIPVFEQGASIIFANFVPNLPSHEDVAILHHEFGHALHNHFTKNEVIMSYRNFPSEIAELAAMAIEAFSMEHLQFYYQDPLIRKEAKKQQLRRFIKLIAWRCMGDVYQHRIYSQPQYSEIDREKIFSELMNRFNPNISWKGVESFQIFESFKILHFYQVPFYYIEYTFAALGALELYRKYKENPSQTLDKYEQFLKQGYNKDIDLLYKEAGTSFDFSYEKIRDLMLFVRQELEI